MLANLKRHDPIVHAQMQTGFADVCIRDEGTRRAESSRVRFDVWHSLDSSIPRHSLQIVRVGKSKRFELVEVRAVLSAARTKVEE